MGAHNATTVAHAASRLAYVAGRIDPGSVWKGRLSGASAIGHVSGSLKRWIEEGREIDTLQVSIRLDGADAAGIAGAWQPGARLVDHAGATYATFNGSRRDYLGVITYAATPDYYIGFTDSVRPGCIDMVVYWVLS